MVPAVLGTARLNNFRLDYLPAALIPIRAARVSILINGVEARGRIRRGSLTIRDIINDSPNTCDFIVQDVAPAGGETVRVLLGDARQLLFAGAVEMVDLTYDLLPDQWVWRVTAIDDTAKLNQIRPYGSWANVSATTVVQDLVARFAPGFTTTHVQAGLAPITVNFDTTEGFSGALKQIAKLIGGYFYVEDMDLHLFTEETFDPPDPVDLDHPPLNDPHITRSVDYSQLRTRVYGKGGGSNTTEAIPVGAVEIPVEEIAWYEAGGGQVTTGPQRITYANMLTGGTTAHGAETQVSPFTTVAARPAPTSAPIAVESANNSAVSFTPGNYQFKTSFFYVGGTGNESLPSPASTTVHLGGLKKVAFSNIVTGATGAAGVAARRIYFAFSASGTPDWSNPSTVSLWTTVGDNTQTSVEVGAGSGFDADPLSIPATYNPGSAYAYVTDTSLFSASGGTAVLDGEPFTYTGRTTASGLGALTGIPTSGAGSIAGLIVVGANGGPGYPAGTTTLPVVDTAQFVATGSSASVGGQSIRYTGRSTSSGVGNLTGIPASGPGALTAVVGGGDAIQAFYPVGATSLTVDDTTNFSASGGVARVGFQTITYTGKSTSSGIGALTGIPASGAGSLTADVIGGETVLVGAGGGGVLSGIPASGPGSVVYAINEGDPLFIWVQRDDLAAQAIYGIHEGPPLEDERRATSSLIALCDAELALYAHPIQTVPYATRDVKTKSGKTVVIDIESPPIQAELVIQDVTITEIDIGVPGLRPKFTATASSVRFSLEDVLRRAAAEQG